MNNTFDYTGAAASPLTSEDFVLTSTPAPAPRPSSDFSPWAPRGMYTPLCEANWDWPMEGDVITPWQLQPPPSQLSPPPSQLAPHAPTPPSPESAPAPAPAAPRPVSARVAALRASAAAKEKEKEKDKATKPAAKKAQPIGKTQPTTSRVTKAKPHRKTTTKGTTATSAAKKKQPAKKRGRAAVVATAASTRDPRKRWPVDRFGDWGL
ncbi:hypothetical protein EDC01DRAFT_776363 [Geopyxis carbonaria]|nr:hypothetical protein EDC01DRAFT_776363 [Geopyxis carbonaria]